MKENEAQKLEELITHQAKVGSARWCTKMTTVHAYKEEAKAFFSQAKTLKEEATEMDKGNAKGKRGREERVEERAKRCRM
jgi:hypothetical protein